MDQNKIITNPKVSVIIPVYNTEAYVEEAIRSIMNQTLTDIEIIIINDGSTDNSLEVIQSLAKEDKRIIVLSQENRGLSEVRNCGVNNAKGEYIYFMDSDDLLVQEALEFCYIKCHQEKLDFTFFDAEIFYDDSTKHLSFDYNRTSFLEKKKYSGPEVLEQMIDKKIYRSSACLYLISHHFIKTHQLAFFPKIIHEDELYSFQLYISAQRVSFINQPFYKRRVRKDSITTNSFSLRNINGYFTVIDQLFLSKKKYDRNAIRVIDKLVNYIINPVIYNAHSLPLQQRMNVLARCVKKGYLFYIRTKNLAVLLFPFFIPLKGLLKKHKNE